MKAEVDYDRIKIDISPQSVDRLYELCMEFPGGVEVRLSPGVFVVSRTVRLPSGTTLLGSGTSETVIVLEKESNCHIFTNDDWNKGSSDISVSGFHVEGNGGFQSRPEGHKRLTFACAFYFFNSTRISMADLSFNDIRQTAAHFNGCETVSVERFLARKLGWSGVSTSGTSDIWVEAIVDEAGTDIMHSGIHFDGGVGIYCQATVTRATGNGIMIDSNYGSVHTAVVRGDVVGCKRGLAIIGSYDNQLEGVVIMGNYSRNVEAGVMISNASQVSIIDAEVADNEGWGLLMQGRNGGNRVAVVNSFIHDNKINIQQLHQSKDNWIFDNPNRRRHESSGVINSATSERFRRMQRNKR